MKLKLMRENAGLSQSELAKISGVNLRSLQDYEQGHKSLLSAKGETLLRLSKALGYSVEDILRDISIEVEPKETESDALRIQRLLAYENRMQARKSVRVHFPVIVADESVDMSCVYPTKQEIVKRVIDEMRTDNRVSSLRLFGSSISMACHKESDVDFAVGVRNATLSDRNEISEKIQDASNWGADIVWLDHLSESDRVYRDIMKGLVLI